MKPSKKFANRKNQLQSHSTIFLQLGILLALVLVYTAFNFKIVKNFTPLPHSALINLEPDIYVLPEFTMEQKEEIKTKNKPQQPKILTDFQIDNTPSDNDTPEFIDTPDDPKVDLDALVDNLPEDDSEPSNVPFVLVEQAPRFPGCKGKTEKEFRDCFNTKMKKFVNKKFNTGNPSISNLYGKQKIFVQFLIDKEGNITEIKVKAPHKSLEKEALRVVHKLPKMIPGKQRTQNVGVRYTLPIAVYLSK